MPVKAREPSVQKPVRKPVFPAGGAVVKPILKQNRSVPSVFKQKSQETRQASTLKARGLRENPEKNGVGKMDRNETSMEKMLKGKMKGKDSQGEMKELIGVLKNLTKTLKDKKNESEDEKESQKTVDLKEKNTQKVIKIELENADFEEDSGRTLTEKVKKELEKDEDEGEDVEKMVNFDKYANILNKANLVSEQIRNALVSGDKLGAGVI